MVDSDFQVSQDKRGPFLRDNILAHLPSHARDAANQRAVRIVDNYVGQDLNALSVLAYAAEKGRFDEFAARLEGHFHNSLQYVHPRARRLPDIPGAVRAEMFFVGCYKDLGVKPVD